MLPAISLCSVCLNCVRLLDSAREQLKNDSATQLDHHESFESLEIAVNGACLVCSYLDTTWFKNKTRPRELSIMCKCLGSYDTGLMLHFTLFGKEPILIYLRLVDDDQALVRHGEEAVAAYTGDDQTLVTARTWMDYCKANHPDCAGRDARSTYRPSRLIDLHPSGLPAGEYWRLVDDTSGLSGGYATLSHRWGQGSLEPYKLTQHTHGDMVNGLPYTCLSRTYCDAMRVVRMLGLRYIWVDSLCVSQDPGTLDIKVAAYRMADIYGHSSCNIAALTARQDGMFSRREPRLYSPAGTMLPASVYDLRSSYAILLAKQWDTSVLEAPLSKRAWILQEQILPRRVLYFGEGQMFWTCSEGAFCELYPLDDITNSWLDEGSLFEGDLGALRQCLSTADGVVDGDSSSSATSTSQPLYLDWMDLLMLYGLRHLTCAEDKLLAIAGMGQLLTSASNRKDTVIGGLIRSELPQNLLWIPDHSTARQQNHGAVRLSPVHRAPSWSWAYYDGPISYFQEHGASSLNLQRPIAQVVEIETDVTVVDDVEIVQGGNMRLLAASLPLEPEVSDLQESKHRLGTTWLMQFASSLPTPSPYAGTDRGLRLYCEPQEVNDGTDNDDWPSEFDGKILFDLSDYSALSGPLTAIFVTTSISPVSRSGPELKNTYCFDGLVVRRHPKHVQHEGNDGKEVYERVGMFAIRTGSRDQPDVPMTRQWHFDDYNVGDGVTSPAFPEYDFDAAKEFMREFVIG